MSDIPSSVRFTCPRRKIVHLPQILVRIIDSTKHGNNRESPIAKLDKGQRPCPRTWAAASLRMSLLLLARRLRTVLPLLGIGPRLAFILLHGMQHQLDGLLWVVSLVALGPVVADGIGKDVAVFVEGRCSDGTANVGIALETVLGILVPEMERAIRAGSRKGSMHWVEGDIVDSVDASDVVHSRVTVTLEGEVGAVR